MQRVCYSIASSFFQGLTKIPGAKLPPRRRCFMLVLSRKLGESIMIGDNIRVTVVDIDRGKVRLGIEAPRDVPIYRQELLPLKDTDPNTSTPSSPNTPTPPAP